MVSKHRPADLVLLDKAFHPGLLFMLKISLNLMMPAPASAKYCCPMAVWLAGSFFDSRSLPTIPYRK